MIPTERPQVRELAARLGLHRAGREWRGTCPLCGYPAAFALADAGGRALAWCASCQDTAGITALLRGAGALPERADDPGRERDRAAEQARKRERALSLWRGSAPITPDDPAGRYLARRGLPALLASLALRFRADCPHPAGGRMPALLALVSGADGEPCGIHRTFLSRDGRKALTEPTKASLGPVAGGAIRLAEAGPEIVIGEGIETAAAAAQMLALPAWSAISAGNLARALVLPDLVRAVIVAVDRDAPGERAAREATARWQREGRRVRWLRPDAAGQDAADVLVAGGAVHA